jgi:hypothetical protein
MRRALFFLFPATVVALACGSRGPLDINGIDYDHPDSGVASDTGVMMMADTGPDVAPGDAGREGGSLINCGQCVATKCGAQLLACFQSMPCRGALQCAVQNCAGGMNGFDPQCMITKCSMYLQGFSQLLPVVTCVVTNCGQDCLGALGGM